MCDFVIRVRMLIRACVMEATRVVTLKAARLVRAAASGTVSRPALRQNLVSGSTLMCCVYSPHTVFRDLCARVTFDRM